MLATAAGAVIGGVAHTSAGAPSQWLFATDGCYYLSDDGGQTATDAACPTGNGSINLYVATRACGTSARPSSPTAASCNSRRCRSTSAHQFR